MVTMLALAGCNVNQGLNPYGQANLGEIYPNYSPYNLIEYAKKWLPRRPLRRRGEARRRRRNPGWPLISGRLSSLRTRRRASRRLWLPCVFL